MLAAFRAEQFIAPSEAAEAWLLQPCPLERRNDSRWAFPSWQGAGYEQIDWLCNVGRGDLPDDRIGARTRPDAARSDSRREGRPVWLEPRASDPAHTAARASGAG